MQYSESDELCILNEVPSIVLLNFAEQLEELDWIKSIDMYTEPNRWRD